MDRGSWWATVHGVIKSWTRLSTYAIHPYWDLKAHMLQSTKPTCCNCWACAPQLERSLHATPKSLHAAMKISCAVTQTRDSQINNYINILKNIKCPWLLKVAQSCPTLWDPMDCPWNSPGQNTGVGSLSLLQGIFPTQRSNPGLPNCSGFFISCPWLTVSQFTVRFVVLLTLWLSS